LKPKFNFFIEQVSKNTGLGVLHVDVGMFVLISFQNLFNLVDIYFLCLQIKTVIAATMFLKGFGGLLFIFSSSFGAFLLVSN
jgi:hypothetical protein